MNDSTQLNFGLIIAYVLPGVIALWGASLFVPTLAIWLSGEPTNAPTIGGFLYVTLGALAVGLTLSAIRWAVLDTFHHLTGVPRPPLNFAQLPAKLAAFNLAVEHYYRYYQFYGNMFVAVFLAALCGWQGIPTWNARHTSGIFLLELILLAASRDSLRRYYERTAQLLGTRGAAWEDA